MKSKRMTKIALSKRQEMILECIRQAVQERGFPPSIREIGDAVGLSSSSTVHSHLKSLESKGYLRRDPSAPRSIEILDNKYKAKRPLIEVPIGLPEEREENDGAKQGKLALPIEIAKDRSAFIYPAPKDIASQSICKGDLLIVIPQAIGETKEKDTVLGICRSQLELLKGDTKVFSENPNESRFLGKVVGVLRTLEPFTVEE